MNGAAPGREFSSIAGLCRRPALLGLLLLAVPATAAEAPRFQLPVDCEPGRDCFVQNHVDAAPGPAARDFTCGPLSYDGHKGTDIRVATLADMRRGAKVLAAATGRVDAVRDGMTDDGRHDPKLERKCGNGVRLSHGGGWTTLYCHMARDSIRVAESERVAAGAVLGLIGLSGRTEFPHLHFGVRRRNRAVDPYTGREVGTGCGGTAVALWAPETAIRLAYRASGLLGLGLSRRQPDWDEVRDGGYRADSLEAGGREIYLWSELFGLRKGDVEVMRLWGPDGRVIAEKRFAPATRDRAVQLHFIGTRRRGGRIWSAGTYRGEFRLLRPKVGGDALEPVLGRRIEVRLVDP